MAPSFAVVICSYSSERWSDLVAATESVRRQKLSARRIVVVIDSNESLHHRVCRELGDVTAVLKGGARGLSGARNVGVAASDEDVVAFLDDDAVADPDWLARFVRLYGDSNVLGVGGTVEPVWSDQRPSWFPKEFQWVVGCTFRDRTAQHARAITGEDDVHAPQPVRNFIGANMSFRRDVFDRVGGFRDGMGRVGARPTGCEETEFCIRLLDQLPGSVLLYEPRARVRHRVPRSRARWSYFWRRCWAEGVSKALVTGEHGRERGLAVERGYTFETLPVAFGQALSEAIAGPSRASLQRAGAIAGGLAVTGAGYLAGVGRPGWQRGYAVARWARAEGPLKRRHKAPPDAA